MLAWCCDLIVASEDAFFADPVVRMGIPGVEWFAHVHQLNARLAKEFLFTGARLSAARAYEIGMINRCVPTDQLETQVNELAERIATMPRMGLALTKMVINQAEDRLGLRDTVEHAYGLHHFAHTHNAAQSDYLAGQDVQSIKKSLKDD